ARPGLEQVPARGAEEMDSLPARERRGVQRIDDHVDAPQPFLEPGAREHVHALAAGEDHNVMPAGLRGPDRVPSDDSGAPGDRDLHGCPLLVPSIVVLLRHVVKSDAARPPRASSWEAGGTTPPLTPQEAPP